MKQGLRENKKVKKSLPDKESRISLSDINSYTFDFPPTLMQNFALLEDAWKKGLLTEDEFIEAEDKAVQLYQSIMNTNEIFYELYRLAIQRVRDQQVEE
ncbi:MAG: hypothetical protein ABF416_04625 [Zymomonas mobilis subsp. pomaceae]